ncbi:LYR motif-containing protein 1 isoform X2 [Alligator sinensis]|uniref:LYR motif-containing protein 1 isoform X2 n=1 Tax=Alligator sinensis TaxID=38654 RepID=A0A3Q0GX80_ALLSI|nr:LYR motif-containing protein 1 isoform X2 [Alligator sinensis]
MRSQLAARGGGTSGSVQTSLTPHVQRGQEKGRQPPPTVVGRTGLGWAEPLLKKGGNAKQGYIALNPEVTRREVLGLYRKIFRIAKKWQSVSGQMEDTIKEKQYIINEAKTLFQKNKNLTDPEVIHQCIEECKARVEIGLHYNIPYPRPIHLPPMGLAQKHGRTFQKQEKLRKLSKPVYLKSYDEIS